MTTYARGISKTVAIAQETTFGTQSAATAQLLRRISADFNLTAQPIESQEINPAAQIRDMRLGPRQVQGVIAGQLSPLSYGMIWSALLRGSWASGVTITIASDSIGTVSSGALTISSAGSNFLTVGFKVGDVVRVSGLTGSANVANGVDQRITALTATSMTFEAAPSGVTFVAWSTTTQTNVTITVSGKKLITPNSVASQSFESFSVEQWYADVSVSELFLGNRVTQASFNFPASGFVTFQSSFIGQNMTTSGSQVYASPTAVTTTTGLTATGGRIEYNGTVMAYITAMNMQVVVDAQAVPVVGAQLVPEIFLGNIMVRGSLSALMTTDTMTADFLAENELQVGIRATTGPSNGAEFISFFLPRVKLAAATRTDSPRAIMRNYSFTGLEQINTSGSGQIYDDTSITIQDSLQT